MEGVLNRAARYGSAVLLQCDDNCKGESHPGSRSEGGMQRCSVDTGRVDGEGSAACCMRDAAAIGQPVLIKEQRSARSTGLCWCGIGRE